MCTYTMYVHVCGTQGMAQRQLGNVRLNSKNQQFIKNRDTNKRGCFLLVGRQACIKVNGGIESVHIHSQNDQTLV